MDLAFHRRPLDPDAPDFFERSTAYFDSIDSFDHEEQSDLYRYFGWDPFHDGPIERLRLSNDAQSLSFRVMHPYIRHQRDESTYAWFRCVFRGVSWFHMTAERVDRYNDPLAAAGQRPVEGIEFNVSEINTLEEQIARARRLWRRPAYSLVIDTFPSHRRLGIVFQHVSVEPLEPVAWELMVRSGEWDTLLYSRGLR